MALPLSRSPLLPALFVVLWSTGFIGAKLGLPYAPPLSFLAIRMALTAAILVMAAVALDAPWPRRREVGHLVVAGLLLHGVYLGGVYVAIAAGVEAGTSALIVSLQPLLVGALAGPLLGERVTVRQWFGLALGLVGCALVVWRKVGSGTGSLWPVLACIAALAGITVGTLYQKRFCQGMDLRSGNVVQFGATALAMGALALLIEAGPVVWSATFVFALAWLILVLSLGAFSLLNLLIRRGAASRVSSLFFLVPPTTALLAWAIFGERLGPVELLGMALAVVGVGLVNLRRG